MKSRLDTWKQNTPRLQLVALMAGIAGDAHNLVDGTVTDADRTQTYHERIYDNTQEALDILRYWPNLDSWD